MLKEWNQNVFLLTPLTLKVYVLYTYLNVDLWMAPKLYVFWNILINLCVSFIGRDLRFVGVSGIYYPPREVCQNDGH